MSKTEVAPVKIAEFDIKKLEFKNLEQEDSVQKFGYIHYKYDKDNVTVAKLQFPEIAIEAGGISRQNEWNPDAFTRVSKGGLKLPFCHNPDDRIGREKYKPVVGINYIKVAQLYSVMEQIDHYCESDEFKNTYLKSEEHVKLFGSDINQYQYVPLIKVPDEYKKTDGTLLYTPPYVKIKIPMKYDKIENKLTDVPDFNAYYTTDGKREKVELKSCEDVIDYFKYRTNIKVVVCMNKIYVKKAKKGTGKTAKREYGVTLKLKYVSAVPQNTSSKSKQSTDEDIFADEDEQTTTGNSSTDKITRSLASLDVEDDDKSDSETTNVKQTSTLKELEDDEDDEDEDEVVEEPKVVVKKKVVAKPAVAKTKTAGK
jgi:hypothetical protein